MRRGWKSLAGNEDIGYDGQPDNAETGHIADPNEIMKTMVMSAIRAKHHIDGDEFDLLWATYELRPESGRPDFIRGECGYQIQNGKTRELGFSVRITYT